jgi:hypothetical protein
MTSNKQQTAVEWYHQQIVDRQNGNGDSRSLDEIFQQAKEMEKQKLEDAWVEGFKNWNPSKTFEQYYNETYGGK